MNEIIVKKALIFSLLFGAILGLLALFPFMVGFMIFILSFLSCVFVILFMKKNEKHLAFITNEQGAILGGIIGFFATIGFFASFSPMVCILHLIFKNYYSYAIPYLLQTGAWLFFVIVFMTAVIFALINSAAGMGLAFIMGHIEKKPENYDTPLDIRIED